MTRPSKLTIDEIAELRKRFGVKDSIMLIGVRGRLKEQASPDFNDRGIYDDAIYLCDHSVLKAFNANTDPSRYKPGVAYLLPGLWTYRIGTHGLSKPLVNQYTALVQAEPVLIARDGVEGQHEGYFGINIHKGGYSTTGSEGCQTIHPDQWMEFMNDLKINMAGVKAKTIKYLLIDQA